MKADDLAENIYDKKVSEIIESMNEINANEYKFSFTNKVTKKVIGAIVIVRGDRANDIIEFMDNLE